MTPLPFPGIRLFLHIMANDPMHLPWCIKYSQTDRDCARHAGEDTLEGGRETIPGKSRATASVAVCSYSASGGARVYGFIPPEHSEGEVVVV